ncbi:MAG: trypsin-like peptidase domain-containing protein, partial [Acholeplasmataceae bacterium]|nr:trypsin-like peptidase domain-containing protein [Acholeplasmataceae bacterium]
MKKILIMTLMIFLMVSLSGCFGYKSYEDLNLEYENFIANQQTSYEENIAFFNGIATETVQSIVLVKKQSASGTSSGSGVVFHAVANTYFVLTNNHVVYRTGIANYTISDYLGNDYSATYMFGDEDYDLAVLRITKKPDISLGVIPFGTENASIDNISAVLGYPNAQINAITLGKVYDYQIIDIDGTDPDIINVTFLVMMTTA